MILTRTVKIRIAESNFQYFENLGYDEVSIGEEILIPVELLSKGSNIKISCKCDGCGSIKEVIYKNYLSYGNDWGMYFCRKCSECKRKESLQKSHGCDYPIQNKKVFKKIKQSIRNKGPK